MKVIKWNSEKMKQKKIPDKNIILIIHQKRCSFKAYFTTTHSSKLLIIKFVLSYFHF